MSAIVEIAPWDTQLANIAKGILSTLNGYTKTSENVPKLVQELLHEMTILFNVIFSPAVLTRKAPFPASASLKSRYEFYRVLDDMNERLTESQKETEQLKWPFSETENEQLLSKLKIWKEAFEMASRQ